MPVTVCTNCYTPISAFGATWAHNETGIILCTVSALRAAGIGEGDLQLQRSGIAQYSACPTPPSDDEPAGPPLVDENDIAEFLSQILSHDEDVLTGLFAGYDEAGNEIPSSPKTEALVSVRPEVSFEQGLLHLTIGNAEFSVRIRRVS